MYKTQREIPEKYCKVKPVPCRFCKSQPIIEDTFYEYGDRDSVIKCSNENCTASVFTEIEWKDRWEIEDLVKEWNRQNGEVPATYEPEDKVLHFVEEPASCHKCKFSDACLNAPSGILEKKNWVCNDFIKKEK